MWDRLTPEAQAGINRTSEIALYFKSQVVSTEHLLLGLLFEEKYSYSSSLGQLKVLVKTENFDSSSPAVKVLLALGVNLRNLKDELAAKLLQTSVGTDIVENLQLSQRGKLVIDLAYDEARNMMAPNIGTEHLLLGLIREHDGLAGQALQKAGVTIEDARRIVFNS